MPEVQQNSAAVKTFDYWTESTKPSIGRIWGSDPDKLLGPGVVDRLSLARMLVAYVDDAPENLAIRHAVQKAYVSGIMHSDEIDRVNRTFPIESRLAKVLTNVCRVYQQGARRKFSEDPAVQDLMTRMYRTSGADAALGEAHLLSRHTGTVSIRPVFRPGGQRIRWQVTTPDRFHITPHPDDSTTAATYCSPFRALLKDGEKVREVTRIRYWTAEETWVTDDRGREVEESREPNRYGRIPYTILRLRDSVGGGVFGPGWFDGVAFQISDNLLRLSGDRNLLYNSFVVVLAVNLGLDRDELQMGAGRILTLENLRDETDMPGGKIPPNLSTLDLQSNFLSVEEFRIQRKKEFLRDNFLPSYYWDDTGSPPSGVALRIQREELRKQAERDRLALTEAERDLDDLVRRMWNNDYVGPDGEPIERPAGERLPDAGDEFAIDYGEEEQYLETTVALEVDQKLLAEGVMPIREYYAKWSGDDGVDSDDDAVARITENKDHAKAIGGTSSAVSETVGGAQSITKLVVDYEAGLISREGALAIAEHVYKQPKEKAESLFVVKEDRSTTGPVGTGQEPAPPPPEDDGGTDGGEA